MATYEMRWVFKDVSFKSLTESPQNREVASRELVESFGGKLLHYYFMMGEFDGMAIVEFPSNEAAAATSMKASASGSFSKFETHALLTAQEAQRAMELVKANTTTYQAPSGTFWRPGTHQPGALPDPSIIALG